MHTQPANLKTVRLRGLYAITDSNLTPGAALLPAVDAVIRGGARLIQYRDKNHDVKLRTAQARALLALCRSHDIPLIINDDVELAADIGADGVHLGREDNSIEEARVRLGPHAIIGASCYNSLETAVRAAHAGADYVAFGSIFSSATKPDAVHAGIDLIEAAHRQLGIAIAAIGGIGPHNAKQAVDAGADMLAVIQAVFAVDDIAAAAQHLSAFYD